jgi:hypothetical protein
MHTSRLVVIAATALAGCAVNPKIQGVEPARPPAMHVSIGYPAGSSPVYPIFVNRDAYVAMFEIIPGRGVTLVYPQSSRQVWASDMHYANLTVQPGRMFYYTDPFSFAHFQPRYYYAVASTAPLNLRPLQTSFGAVRRLLGRMYGSYRPYEIIDNLTNFVVPTQPDEDWATDLLVVWPEPPPPKAVLTRIVRCANGRVLVVDRDYPYYGCPGDAKLVAAAPDTTRLVKELPFDTIPRRQRGETREAIELTAPEVDNRRRAEAGAPLPPRSGRADREGIRYSDDYRSRTPRREPSGSPGSEPRSRGETKQVERSEPRTQPAPERSEPRVQSPPKRGADKARKPS